MSKWSLVGALIFSIQLLAFAPAVADSSSVEEAVSEENAYVEYFEQLQQDRRGFARWQGSISKDSEQLKLLTDAAWDLVTLEGVRSPLQLDRGQLEPFMDVADRLRWEMLEVWPKAARPSSSLVAAIQRSLREGIDRRTPLLMESYRENLQLPPELEADLQSWRGVQELSEQLGFRRKTSREIRDLYFSTPDLATYKGGRYANGVRLFMFCRKSRLYPCQLLMKDLNNRPVYRSDGKLWHQPALGLSKVRRRYNQRNGNTPSGVYTLDSVMPSANKQQAFGKFRRIIMNFVPSSRGEAYHRLFLPATAHGADWWKEAVSARDVGRNLLRIHGTGRLASSPSDPYHPLRPTFGCVMQREGQVGNREYRDQRLLLDQVMRALRLSPVYDNETRISGAFYVIDIDDQKRAVTYADLKSLLAL